MACPVPEESTEQYFLHPLPWRMEKQNQVKRTLEQPSSMDAIRAILARNEHTNRASLVRCVCGTFGLLDSRGGPQIGGCSKALRELERAGHFVLPASTRPNVTGPKGPRRLDAAVPAPLDVPEQAGEVRALAWSRGTNHRLGAA